MEPLHTDVLTRDDVGRAVRAANHAASPSETDSAYRAFLTRTLAPRPRRTPSVPWTNGLFYGAAALVAGVAISIVTLRSHYTSATPAVERTYATERAQRATVELPDGSRAQLAPATRLHYRADADGHRTLDLEGEAYFDVVHDPARSFVVRTGSVHTRVLGTAFDVRRYPTDSTTRVAVVTGKVEAGAAGAPRGKPALVLSQGMAADVTDSTTRTVSVDPRALTQWTQGRLLFSDTPIPTVLQALNRWTGYEFRLADSTLAGRYVTTVLPTDDPAQLVVMLEALLDVRATISGHVVTLRASRSAPARRELLSNPKTSSTSLHGVGR